MTATQAAHMCMCVRSVMPCAHMCTMCVCTSVCMCKVHACIHLCKCVSVLYMCAHERYRKTLPQQALVYMADGQPWYNVKSSPHRPHARQEVL